jgi:DNA polymerase-3 subunit gamma/tau
MSKSKHQVLARKYRPGKFGDVVGQEAIVTTLKNALKFDKVAHAYLFCGSRGVGKTTLARLFAKALNCEKNNGSSFQGEPCNECPSCVEINAGQSLDVIEIDGASNRGIDDIRQINETVVYAPSQGRFKIYIIDEVHMLTKEAFNALLKTLEEPPEKVKFFFATTEPHKILPTIISRCQRFDLGRIPLSQIVSKLGQIATDLNRKAEESALHLIASFSDGSLRDAESLFDQILCFAEEGVTEKEVRGVLGLISQEYFFELDKAFSESKVAYAFELVETLFASGKDLNHFYELLIQHVRLICLAKTRGEKSLELPQDTGLKYLESAKLYTTAQCLYLLDYLLRGESQIHKSVCQRVSLEAALLHYIQSKNRIPVEVLVRKLTELKDAAKTLDLSPATDVKASLPEMKPAPIEITVEPPPEIKAASIEIAVEPPPEVKAAPIEIITETPPEIKVAPVEAIILPPLHHPSHYDTLVRFAAVELEGTVKK